MRDGWKRTVLGDITHQWVDPVPVRLDVDYTNLGLRMYAGGVFAREAKSGSQIKAKRLFRVKSGQFIYNRLFAGGGSFGIVRDEHANGVVSNEFPTFDVDASRLSVDYLYLYFQQPDVWGTVSEQCIGTTQTRLRWKEERFNAYAIPLPPLHEQRRIVDLIGALDDTIAAAEESLLYARASLAQLRRIPAQAGGVPLGGLVTMRSGPSWKAADESAHPGTGYTPVLGITNTPATGRLDLNDRKFVRGIPASAQRLDDSSLVMIRTNGNRSRIGNIYRATSSVAGFAVSAFQIAVQPHDANNSAYLFWYLGSTDVQASISESASGSTGLGNIAVGWLKQLNVPLLSESEKVEYVATCQAADAVVSGLETTSAELRTLRSNLLTDLLSGEHEIPESYDELMGEAS